MVRAAAGSSRPPCDRAWATAASATTVRMPQPPSGRLGRGGGGGRPRPQRRRRRKRRSRRPAVPAPERGGIGHRRCPGDGADTTAAVRPSQRWGGRGRPRSQRQQPRGCHGHLRAVSATVAGGVGRCRRNADANDATAAVQPSQRRWGVGLVNAAAAPTPRTPQPPSGRLSDGGAKGWSRPLHNQRRGHHSRRPTVFVAVAGGVGFYRCTSDGENATAAVRTSQSRRRGRSETASARATARTPQPPSARPSARKGCGPPRPYHHDVEDVTATVGRSRRRWGDGSVSAAGPRQRRDHSRRPAASAPEGGGGRAPPRRRWRPGRDSCRPATSAAVRKGISQSRSAGDGKDATAAV